VTDNLQKFLSSLAGKDQLVHSEVLLARESAYGNLADPLPSELKKAMESIGASRLYTHQVQCIDAVRRGEDVVVSTGTSSGKTLAFLLPIIESILKNSETRALFVYPTNALVNDQAANLKAMLDSMSLKISFGVYTGQTQREEREKIKKTQPNILLTNPEMIHFGILPYHFSWAKSLTSSRWKSQC